VAEAVVWLLLAELLEQADLEAEALALRVGRTAMLEQ
jgi:hypothetical protein